MAQFLDREARGSGTDDLDNSWEELRHGLIRLRGSTGAGSHQGEMGGSEGGGQQGERGGGGRGARAQGRLGRGVRGLGRGRGGVGECDQEGREEGEAVYQEVEEGGGSGRGMVGRRGAGDQGGERGARGRVRVQGRGGRGGRGVPGADGLEAERGGRVRGARAQGRLGRVQEQGGRGGGKRVRARAWVYTTNNYYESVDQQAPLPVLSSNMTYICYGREVCPTTGTPHLQGYVHFKSPVQNPQRYFSAFGPHTHLERAVGTAEENREYCSKDGDFVEYGELPYSPKEKGVKEQERWQAAFDSAKEGKLDDIPADIRTRYYNTYNKIKMDYAPKASHLDGPLKHLWIVGRAGSGKSTWAYR